MSDSVDELMEGLNVDTSNDITVEKMKDFKKMLLKSVNKFDKYIKQDTKKKDIEKKDTKNSIEYDANNNNNNNNKPDIKLATSDDIKAHITDKQKLIKKDIKVY